MYKLFERKKIAWSSSFKLWSIFTHCNVLMYRTLNVVRESSHVIYLKKNAPPPPLLPLKMKNTRPCLKDI